jgi:SPW repeat
MASERESVPRQAATRTRTDRLDRVRYPLRATNPRATDPTRPPAGGPVTYGPGGREDWRDTVRIASGLNLLAGIWLIIAPFVLGYGGGDPYWNDIVFGAIVAGLALVRVSGAYRASWMSWLNVLIGAWIFISAFWLDNTWNAGTNDIIVGAIVFVLGLVSAQASEDAATGRRVPPGETIEVPPRW